MSGTLKRKAAVRLVACTLCAALFLSMAMPVLADTAAQKAVRGLANLGCGIVALPGEIYATWQKDGPALAWSAGLGAGLGMVVARTMVGFFELTTSPAPWPKEDFAPLIEPPFPWSYFQESAPAGASEEMGTGSEVPMPESEEVK